MVGLDLIQVREALAGLNIMQTVLLIRTLKSQMYLDEKEKAEHWIQSVLHKSTCGNACLKLAFLGEQRWKVKSYIGDWADGTGSSCCIL